MTALTKTAIQQTLAEYEAETNPPCNELYQDRAATCGRRATWLILCRRCEASGFRCDEHAAVLMRRRNVKCHHCGKAAVESYDVFRFRALFEGRDRFSGFGKRPFQ